MDIQSRVTPQTSYSPEYITPAFMSEIGSKLLLAGHGAQAITGFDFVQSPMVVASPK